MIVILIIEDHVRCMRYTIPLRQTLRNRDPGLAAIPRDFAEPAHNGRLLDYILSDVNTNYVCTTRIPMDRQTRYANMELQSGKGNGEIDGYVWSDGRERKASVA